MFKLIFAFLSLLTLPTTVFAVGMTIATMLAFEAVWMTTAVAFAINMVASAIISKAFFNPNQPSGGFASPDVGNRQQLPPATDNKLPVVYGNAYVGGTITDLSISEDNQEIYYVLSISEVTGGETPDTFSFGSIYWGGKKCIFDDTYTPTGTTVTAIYEETNSLRYSGTEDFKVGDNITFSNIDNPIIYQIATVYKNSLGTVRLITLTTTVPSGIIASNIFKYNANPITDVSVKGLLDESTGIVDRTVNGKIEIYLYSNGSYNAYNSIKSAITVMQSDGLIYKWDGTKLMTNCVFAIVHLSYSQTANIRGIEQTRFQILNSRNETGNVFYDYLTNTQYGAGIPLSQINTTSLDELTSYSNEIFTYIDNTNNVSKQPRFLFNGVIDTKRTIMDNLQDMASCCDCLIKYNEITAQWGVVVQKPTYTVAMDLNDSNMVSAISVNPIDLAGSYNIVECKFPDNSVQDSFNTATFDLAEIAPELLFPNEPINKMSISLPLVNNDIQAQYIAIRLLKSAREDLQLQVNVNFSGIQLEAGDIVTVTNANYGWTAKPFRINKVIEQFGDDGNIIAKLTLSEFNSSVYDDVSITQYTPSLNTGISDPTFFGSVPAPIISSQQQNSAVPSFNISVTTSSSGIIQYAEIWYSAFISPTNDQLIFAGTTAIQSNGNPYQPNTIIPDATLSNIPAGNWYFFSRMVNSLASSSFSPASAKFQWSPTTIQYSERWLVVAYADNATGTVGFDTNPRNKAYYGLANSASSTPITNPDLYTWYEANPSFSTDKYLLFTNRTGRKFSFGTGQAEYVANNSFVPSDVTIYDQSIWSALPDETNYIDLDHRTGQIIETATTTIGTGEIKVTNDSQGKLKASLAVVPALETLSGGAQTFTATVAKLTIDIYGRILGFEPPDNFDYTMEQFNASSGQTVFTVTRGSNYLIDNCFVFQNGVLLDESEYTDTAGSTGTVTLAVGADLGDIITIISMKSVNLVTGSYNSFTRHTVDLTSASSYTASGFTLVSGYELLFLNGTIVYDQDYDIIGQTIQNFPNLVTGKLTIIQWSNNNLNIPNGTPINVVTNSVIGQATYPFSYIANSLNIYQNGVLLDENTDYTAGFGEYTLANTPTDVNQVLFQQTFNRTGAV